MSNKRRRSPFKNRGQARKCRDDRQAIAASRKSRLHYHRFNDRLNDRIRAKCQSYGFASYQDYLASERWTAFRTRAMHHWGYKCLLCQRTPIMMHHTSYARICDESVTDVIPLCKTHHRAIHEYHRRTMTGVSRIVEAVCEVVGCSVTMAKVILRPKGEYS